MVLALEHLARINSWTVAGAERYAQLVFELWVQRSRFTWELDLSFLDALGIKYKRR